VRLRTAFAFTLGVAAAAAATVYAGAGAVAQALHSLHLTGLLLIALLHVPIGAAMGLAWWLAAGEAPPASRARFCWARFVRDAAAEVLPFSQLGGFVLGVRALGLARTSIARGAVSMSIDLVIELAAKLPYVAAALAALLTLAPHSALLRPLAAALAVTCLAVSIPLLARARLWASLEAMAYRIARRWPTLGTLNEELRRAFDRTLLSRPRLFTSFALHLACWFLGAGEAWVVFRLLGVHLSLAEALAIDGAVAALRTFGFMIPAAAGVQEASYLLGAAVFGIPPAVAVAASLARRARDLALGVVTFAMAVPGDPTMLPPALRSALHLRRDVKTDTRSR
jgi:glycosyltransferase 2 family protein